MIVEGRWAAFAALKQWHVAAARDAPTAPCGRAWSGAGLHDTQNILIACAGCRRALGDLRETCHEHVRFGGLVHATNPALRVTLAHWVARVTREAVVRCEGSLVRTGRGEPCAERTTCLACLAGRDAP